MKFSNTYGAMVDEFSQTIPKSLVHKKNIENVLLTHIEQSSENEYECVALLPRTHIFFCQFDEAPHKNIVLISEICRQVSIAVAHLFCDVPMESYFVASGMEYSLLDTTMENELKENKITLRVRKEAADYSLTGELKGIRYSFEIYFKERHYAGFSSILSLYTKKQYEKLRLFNRSRIVGVADPLPKPTVSRELLPIHEYTRLIEDVFHDKGGNGISGALVVDMRHLFFFDHYNDHISGMLIVAGIRQLALRYIEKQGHSQKHYRLSSMQLQFLRFGELDITAKIELSEIPESTDNPSLSLQVKINQNKSILVKGAVCFTRIK